MSTLLMGHAQAAVHLSLKVSTIWIYLETHVYHLFLLYFFYCRICTCWLYMTVWVDARWKMHIFISCPTLYIYIQVSTMIFGINHAKILWLADITGQLLTNYYFFFVCFFILKIILYFYRGKAQFIFDMKNIDNMSFIFFYSKYIL